MPFMHTEQFTIWLGDSASGPLALLPATSERPWRLLQGQELLASIPLPPGEDVTAVFAAVQAVAAAHDWQVRACGACTHWHASSTAIPGGVGLCTWLYSDHPPGPSAQQNILAAPCDHFSTTDTTPAPPPAPAPLPTTVVPEPGRAWWQRWRPRRPDQVAATSHRWEQAIVERSGKRPGTIPCLTCPGRMANLGAQKCRTHEGDERTFSIWRCRQCQGYYLNDWTDKWVRTDALEVVDIYYRLAPREALTCLERIEQAGEGRLTPAELQAWAETYLAGRTPIRAEVRRAR